MQFSQYIIKLRMICTIQIVLLFTCEERHTDSLPLSTVLHLAALLPLQEMSVIAVRLLDAAKLRLHLARHSSPPVPGAVTSGYRVFRDAKVASGMPVAEFKILLGILINEPHIV